MLDSVGSQWILCVFTRPTVPRLFLHTIGACVRQIPFHRSRELKSFHVFSWSLILWFGLAAWGLLYVTVCCAMFNFSPTQGSKADTHTNNWVGDFPMIFPVFSAAAHSDFQTNPVSLWSRSTPNMLIARYWKVLRLLVASHVSKPWFTFLFLNRIVDGLQWQSNLQLQSSMVTRSPKMIPLHVR